MKIPIPRFAIPPRRFAAALLLVTGFAQAGSLPWSDAQQMVLVTIAHWNATQGSLQIFQLEDRQWQALSDPVEVTIGRGGAAWGVGLHQAQPGPVKREGDGRSPAGVYRIGTAFGYANIVRTGLHYQPMHATDYCIDVSTSPLYNQIVDARQVGESAVAGSTEPMRRDIHLQGDSRYRAGFVIEHNRHGLANAGSCIFAHLWKAPGEPTAGCTAMAEAVMEKLLASLHADRHPVFVLLPQAEYLRLREPWQLPAIGASADLHPTLEH